MSINCPTSSANYQLNDRVFAKMKAYPPWPAKVIEILQNKKYKVFFYGTHDHAVVSEDNLVKYGAMRKIPKSKLKRYSEALKEIRLDENNRLYDFRNFSGVSFVKCVENEARKRIKEHRKRKLSNSGNQDSPSKKKKNHESYDFSKFSESELYFECFTPDQVSVRMHVSEILTDELLLSFPEHRKDPEQWKKFVLSMVEFIKYKITNGETMPWKIQNKINRIVQAQTSSLCSNEMISTKNYITQNISNSQVLHNSSNNKHTSIRETLNKLENNCESLLPPSKFNKPIVNVETESEEISNSSSEVDSEEIRNEIDVPILGTSENDCVKKDIANVDSNFKENEFDKSSKNVNKDIKEGDCNQILNFFHYSKVDENLSVGTNANKKSSFDKKKFVYKDFKNIDEKFFVLNCLLKNDWFSVSGQPRKNILDRKPNSTTAEQCLLPKLKMENNPYLLNCNQSNSNHAQNITSTSGSHADKIENFVNSTNIDLDCHNLNKSNNLVNDSTNLMNTCKGNLTVKQSLRTYSENINEYKTCISNLEKNNNDGKLKFEYQNNWHNNNIKNIVEDFFSKDDNCEMFSEKNFEIYQKNCSQLKAHDNSINDNVGVNMGKGIPREDIVDNEHSTFNNVQNQLGIENTFRCYQNQCVDDALYNFENINVYNSNFLNTDKKLKNIEQCQSSFTQVSSKINECNSPSDKNMSMNSESHIELSLFNSCDKDQINFCQGKRIDNSSLNKNEVKENEGKGKLDGQKTNLYVDTENSFQYQNLDGDTSTLCQTSLRGNNIENLTQFQTHKVQTEITNLSSHTGMHENLSSTSSHSAEQSSQYERSTDYQTDFSSNDSTEISETQNGHSKLEIMKKLVLDVHELDTDDRIISENVSDFETSSSNASSNDEASTSSDADENFESNSEALDDVNDLNKKKNVNDLVYDFFDSECEALELHLKLLRCLRFNKNVATECSEMNIELAQSVIKKLIDMKLNHLILLRNPNIVFTCRLVASCSKDIVDNPIMKWTDSKDTNNNMKNLNRKLCQYAQAKNLEQSAFRFLTQVSRLFGFDEATNFYDQFMNELHKFRTSTKDLGWGDMNNIVEQGFENDIW